MSSFDRATLRHARGRFGRLLGSSSARRLMSGVYVVAVAAIGMILVFRATPMSGTDETYHFRRALQVSEGHFLARRLGPNNWGGKLDRHTVGFARWFDDHRNGHVVATQAAARTAERSLANEPGGRMIDSFPSTASYPPLPYLPAAFGLLVGRLTAMSGLAQIYAGRVGCLVGFLIGLLAIVRVLPCGRLGALMILTTPTAIDLAASYSADPMTNTIGGLFAAWCLRLRAMGGDKFSATRKTGFLLLAVSAGLLKLTCAALSPLCLLIPDAAFSSRRRAWCFKLSAIGCCVGTALIWNFSFPFRPGLYWGSGADPEQSIAHAMRAPFHEAILLGYNVWHFRYWWWVDGYSQFGGGSPFYFIFGGVTAAAALVGLSVQALIDEKVRPLPWTGALLIAVAVFYVLLLVLAFQIAYSPVASFIVLGLQGRYFLLPVLLLYLGTVVTLPSRLQSQPLALANAGVYLLLTVDIIVRLLRVYHPLWL